MKKAKKFIDHVYETDHVAYNTNVNVIHFTGHTIRFKNMLNNNLF